MIIDVLKVNDVGLGKCSPKGILTTELHSSRSTSMTAGELREKPAEEPARRYLFEVNLDQALLYCTLLFILGTIS